MAVAMASHARILTDVIDRHGGVRPVEQGEGDSVVAAFMRASQAVAAAVEAQAGLRAERWPDGVEVRVRMGLHSGEATLRDERNYAGPVIIRCARIRALARGGQVLVSDATRALVTGDLPDGARLVEFGRPRLKGLTRTEPVYELLDPQVPGDPASRRVAHPS